MTCLQSQNYFCNVFAGRCKQMSYNLQQIIIFNARFYVQAFKTYIKRTKTIHTVDCEGRLAFIESVLLILNNILVHELDSYYPVRHTVKPSKNGFI